MQLPEIKLFPHQQRSLDETERFENAAYYLDMRWVLVKLSLDRSAFGKTTPLTIFSFARNQK